MGKKEFIESLKSLGEKRALSTEAESTLYQFNLNMRFELEFTYTKPSVLSTAQILMADSVLSVNRRKDELLVLLIRKVMKALNH